MKRLLKRFSFFFVIALMAFFIIKNYANKNETVVEAASQSNMVDIKLINGNKKAGNLVFTVDSGTQTYTEKTVYAGSKIKIFFDGGLNDGYEIYTWANTNGVTYTVSNNSSGEKYTKDTFSFTAKTDATMYCAAKLPTDHVVTFYETSSTALSSIIGFSIVGDGEKASTENVFIPHRKGFDFKAFNYSLDNITEDTILYPTYKSNVLTIFRDYWSLFVKGLGITILLAVLSIFLSLFVGLAICLGKLSKFKWLNVVCSAYIEIIRGVPSLLLLLIVYCVVGPTKIHIGSFFSTEVLSCILALFINSSAYTAEIFRSGVQAVDQGQTEAGRALGLSNFEVLRKIVLPQGLKNALPSLGNELVMIIKETSLAYSINNAIGELMSAKVTITSVTGNSLSPYIIIAVIYFIVTFTLSRAIQYLEKRLSQ